jgi:hypothetical protein
VTDQAPDVSTPEAHKAYITEMSAAAQRAEIRGDQLQADFIHEHIDRELDELRDRT